MATIAGAANQPPATASKVREEPIGDSSFIAMIKYDPAQLQLTVTTKRGDEYVHFYVFPATVDQFLQSPSKGAFYNAQIKGKGIGVRTITKKTGPPARNLARGPVEHQTGRRHG